MLNLPAEVLNHLLEQSGWALARLQKFAGKTARFHIAPFSFAYTVLSNGALLAAPADVPAEATCNIPPSLLPRLALKDEAAFSLIETQGDAALLTEIFYLSKHLKWDAAEDISKVTGDIAAERIVQYATSAQLQIHASVLNLAQAFSEYWTEERPLVAKSVPIQQFIQQVDTLRDDLARLEQRINRLHKA